LKIVEHHVVSKKRVEDHGEVYTRAREVNAMLDLVKQETERIESRFLEPACGTGNFLVEVLRRKLEVVTSRYRRTQLECERYAVLAVSSIYGIDILEDNVTACRNRLFYLFEEYYLSRFQRKAKKECLATVKFILGRNIIHGDALTLQTVGDNPQFIIFSEWSFVKGSMIKRRDFTFQQLLTPDKQKQITLFNSSKTQKSDTGKDIFIPEPVKDYPLTHFLRVADAECP